MGSVCYKTGGKPLKFDESMRLPPLNCKPVFNDVANNTTVSNLELTPQADYRNNRGSRNVGNTQSS